MLKKKKVGTSSLNKASSFSFGNRFIKKTDSAWLLVVVTMHVHPSLLGSADYSRRASCRNWDVFKGVFRSKQHFLQFHMQLLVSCHHDCNAAQAYTCPHLYQMASRVRAGALPLPVLVATRTTANVPSALPPLWICAQVSMPTAILSTNNILS